VDHGGKLFERTGVDKSVAADKQDRQNQSRHSTLSASFCPRHGNHRGRELSASQGQVSFATFLCLPKKSRNDKELSMIIVEVESVTPVITMMNDE